MNTNQKRWFDNYRGYFSLPRAMMFDDRLGHTDFRLLVAIASFVMKEDKVFPSRQTLDGYTGIGVTNISRRTKKLQEFGWLEKQWISGGRMHYTLKVPEYVLNRMNEKSRKNIDCTGEINIL
jgi:hypothetical protein